MAPLQAFNTTISFISNTDWQSYAGEKTLSTFSQMAAITFAMFTSAATGFVVAMAFIRAFIVRNGGAGLGNFYRDLVRLLPLCFLIALFLVWQGSPQTLAAGVVAHTLQGAGQAISLGPVAALERIKHLGTNGGGFFNGNGAQPFENPSDLSNFLLVLLLMSLFAAIVVAVGEMIGRRRQGGCCMG